MKMPAKTGSRDAVRQLFRGRPFLAYFTGLHSFALAYSIGSAAIAWQVFALRHRPLDLGLVGLTLFLPTVVLALPAGVLADRGDRRIICIASSIAECLAMLALFQLSRAHVHTLAPYFAVIAFIGIAEAIATPADRTLLVSVVRGPAYLRATAFSSSTMSVVRIAAPAVAGLLIAIQTPLAFVVAACIEVVATIAYTFLPRLQPELHDSGASLWEAAVEGIRFIARKRIVLSAISLDLFAVLLGGAIALLPIYAVQILHVGPTGFGALRAAPLLGTALVGLYLARHPVRRHAGPTLLWCVAGFGLATIVFGVSRSLVLSLLALAATGGFDMVSMVIRNVLVQYGTPDPLRGRVNAVENIFIGASNELGEFESGLVAALLNAEASVVLGGVATLCVVALASVVFPELRGFDRILSDAEEQVGAVG